jgi:hypothetical protein
VIIEEEKGEQQELRNISCQFECAKKKGSYENGFIKWQ